MENTGFKVSSVFFILSLFRKGVINETYHWWLL